jgi:hypothetical protein
MCGQVAQLLRGGSWFNNPHNARAAFRNSNNPDNDNTNIGLRPCCPSPPAPFTVRTAARDCSGRTRRVQTRSSDHRRSRLIRTSPAHCPRPHDLAGRWAFPAGWHASHVVDPIQYGN